MSKIEKGVMIMKDGKAWGITYQDGHCTVHGWMDNIEDAPIHNPQFCTNPTDAVYKGSPDTKEIIKGELVPVERVTTVTIVGT